MADGECWPPADIDLHDRSRWLTPAEAAHRARVSERTIRRWARERNIAICTPGGRVWIAADRLFTAPLAEMSEMSDLSK